MPDTGVYWVQLKDGDYITARWDEATGRWSFRDDDNVLTPDEIAALGHTVLIRHEGDERVDDMLRRYREQKPVTT